MPVYHNETANDDLRSDMSKPYSESCDQNRDVIFDVISPIFRDVSSVLEIGSGTGQHAVYFAEKMPYLHWYTSDQASYHEGIQQWIDEAALSNVAAPIELNVTTSPWPEISVDAVFTANSLHIMHNDDADNLLAGVGKLLDSHGSLVIYGPFNYEGTYTSDSNARFDDWLKGRDPMSGIKHFETIVAVADDNGLRLASDIEMPANNRILHFIKV